jgi:beta-phosphoglucomutase
MNMPEQHQKSDTAHPRGSRYAVIWDVDGTLVDTAEQHFAAWQIVARQLARSFTREDFFATFGRRNPEIIREVFGTSLTPQEVAELGDRKEELYRAGLRQGVSLLPGVRTLLEGLHAAGIKQGIGSSAPRANLDLVLRVTQSAGFFDAVVSMEDTDRGKPDPQVFLVAAAKLNVSPDRCLVLEDAPSGVQAAKTGGMKCIAVQAAGHHSNDVLRQAGANLVVGSLTEVGVPTVLQILASN